MGEYIAHRVVNHRSNTNKTNNQINDINSSINSLISFLDNLIKHVDTFLETLKTTFEEYMTNILVKKLKISHDEFKKVQSKYHKLTNSLDQFLLTITKDYGQLLSVGYEINSLQRKFDYYTTRYKELTDKQQIAELDRILTQLSQITRKHNKLAIYYNGEIAKYNFLQANLKHNVIVYRSSLTKKTFSIPFNVLIRQFKNLIQFDKVSSIKKQVYTGFLEKSSQKIQSLSEEAPLLAVRSINFPQFNVPVPNNEPLTSPRPLQGNIYEMYRNILRGMNVKQKIDVIHNKMQPANSNREFGAERLEEPVDLVRVKEEIVEDDAPLGEDRNGIDWEERDRAPRSLEAELRDAERAEKLTETGSNIVEEEEPLGSSEPDVNEATMEYEEDTIQNQAQNFGGIRKRKSTITEASDELEPKKMRKVDKNITITKKYYDDRTQMVNKKIEDLDNYENNSIILKNAELCTLYRELKGKVDNYEKEKDKFESDINALKNTNDQVAINREQEHLANINDKIANHKDRIQEIIDDVEKLDADDYKTQEDKHRLYLRKIKLIKLWRNKLIEDRRKMNLITNNEEEKSVQQDRDKSNLNREIVKLTKMIKNLNAEIDENYYAYGNRNDGRQSKGENKKHFCSRQQPSALRYEVTLDKIEQKAKRAEFKKEREGKKIKEEKDFQEEISKTDKSKKGYSDKPVNVLTVKRRS